MIFRKAVLSNQSHIYLSCDKGTSGNFIKMISYYNFEKKKVDTYTLDIEASGGNSADAAIAIHHFQY